MINWPTFFCFTFLKTRLMELNWGNANRISLSNGCSVATLWSCSWDLVSRLIDSKYFLCSNCLVDILQYSWSVFKRDIVKLTCWCRAIACCWYPPPPIYFRCGPRTDLLTYIKKPKCWSRKSNAPLLTGIFSNDFLIIRELPRKITWQVFGLLDRLRFIAVLWKSLIQVLGQSKGKEIRKDIPTIQIWHRTKKWASLNLILQRKSFSSCMYFKQGELSILKCL